MNGIQDSPSPVNKVAIFLILVHLGLIFWIGYVYVTTEGMGAIMIPIVAALFFFPAGLVGSIYTVILSKRNKKKDLVYYFLFATSISTLCVVPALLYSVAIANWISPLFK